MYWQISWRQDLTLMPSYCFGFITFYYFYPMSISFIFLNSAKHFKLYYGYFIQNFEEFCTGIPQDIQCTITFPERGSKLCLKPGQTLHLELASFKVSPKCTWDLPIQGAVWWTPRFRSLTSRTFLFWLPHLTITPLLLMTLMSSSLCFGKLSFTGPPLSLPFLVFVWDTFLPVLILSLVLSFLKHRRYVRESIIT